MKNKKICLGILVMVLVFEMAIVGCGGASSLAGKWVPEEGQGRISSDFPERSMELLSDGTSLTDGMSWSWKAEKGRIYFTGTWGAYAYDYKVSGSTLILTSDDGRSVTYKKQ